MCDRTYLWLGLEGLAHGTEDVNFAGSEPGGIGGFGRHGCVVVGLMCGW